MFEESNKYSFKNRHTVSYFNKYLINSIEDYNNINESSKIPKNKVFNIIKPFKKTKKEVILEKLDTSNFKKKLQSKDKRKSLHRFNTINYDDSQDLIMATKLSTSFISQRTNFDSNIYYHKKINKYKNNRNDIDNYLLNNITKEQTNSLSENDFQEIYPLELYNRKAEYISFVIKIQSFWRKYYVRKKIKLCKFIILMNQIIYKYYIYFIKIFFFNCLNTNYKYEKIYCKKFPEKSLIKVIKKNINFHLNKSFKNKGLEIDKKRNEITIIDKNINLNSNNKRNKNLWIKLPLSLEKYAIKIVITLHGVSFFEQLKFKEKEMLKQKKIKILNKLAHQNDIKNLKRYMSSYREKIMIGKGKQKIYFSLIKPKFKSRSKSKKSIFDFQSFYKQKTLKDLINKYGNSLILKKYYFLWKKKAEENNNSKGTKKKMIKIKKVKKNSYIQNDFKNIKEDIINNVSDISHDMSFTSNNTLNSIQTIKKMNICLTSTNKKMRIKKIAVTKNYYKYIENNNNNYNK